MRFTVFLIKTAGEARSLHRNNARPLQMTYHAEQLFQQNILFSGMDFGETAEHWVSSPVA